MSNAVATVAFLQGQAWAKAPDGSLRPLSVGSVLNADETLVTAQGAQVQLDFGNGEPIQVNGGLEVAMSRDFNNDTATDADDAALNDASVQEALTVLEQGGDLLEELEETAAGDNGGGGSDGNNSFVQLTRIFEQTDSQFFTYQNTTVAENTVEETDGNGVYTNRAPSATDQILAGNEDEVISGQIIATDIEGDALTYVVTTAPANGTLTLDATTGQFIFTPNGNYNGSDSFVVTVTDGRGNSSISTVSLNIAPVNDAPTANNISLTTAEDASVNGQVIAQDVEGDTLAYSVSGQPANGTVTLNAATGSFVYTPNANYNGSDSFVVTISDGKGGTTTSTITIGVTPVNDAPTSSALSLTTAEDQPVNGQVVASDVDGDTLGYTVSGNPTNGTVTLNAATGSFVYTPNANYNGSDSFVVTISDGKGGTTTSTITIGVTPVNDAPTSSALSLTTEEDQPVNGQIVASDVDGDTLGYTVSNNPTNGTVTLNAATGSFVFTPNANYNGSDSFVVTISDGKGGTTTSTVTIGVTPANDAPTSTNQNLTTSEDTDLTGQIVANDADGDTLGYTVSGNPTNGTVTLNAATGSFVYTPNANYNGSDSFVVTISDGKGGTTTSTVTIGVTPANDAPTSANQNLTTAEDTDLTGQIVANDADGDTLGYTVSGNPTNGTVTLNAATGSFVYTPNTNYSGSDSFVVTISDGKGGTTTSTITIGVTPANDAPETSDVSLTTDEDVPVNGAVIATDLDGDVLSYTVSGSPANGTVVLNSATGTFTYTPNNGYAGGDSFVVTASDGKGGTATSTVSIGVTAVNQAPTASNDSATTDEDTAVVVAVRGNDVDPDGDSLTVTGVSQGANGSVVIDAVTGNPIYTPNFGFTGTDTFTYTVSDGNGGTTSASVTVTVNAVIPANTAPVAVADSITVQEGGSVTTLDGGSTSVLANDTDLENNPLTAILVTGPAHGSLTFNPNGTFSYIHDGSETTADSFTYKVNDGTVDGNTVTVNITVNPANDVPVANDDFYTINEDQTLTIPLSGLTLNDTDADGDSLTVAQVLNPVHGSVSVVGGNFVFTPDANFSGTASFDYRVSDGKGGQSTATVHITVVAVDDPTIAAPDTKTTLEDTATTGNVLSNDSDVDNALSVASFSINGATYNANATAVITGVGSVKIEANGSYLFQPVSDYNGAVPTITYTTNTGVSSTLDITVTPVNDDPVANDDSFTINMNSALTITPAVANSLLANDTDVDGGTLVVDMVVDANHGTISFVGNDVIFTPDAGFSGVASFTYYISDGKGGSSSATVYVNVVNQPSVLVADVQTTNEDAPVSGNVLSNDTDPDEALSVASFSISGNNYAAGATANIPLVGSITLQANGTYNFTPAPEYNGAVPTLTYTTNTGVSSTLDITVTPVNDAPVAVADSITVAEGGTVTVLVGGATSVLANDTDAENNTLSAILVTGPANGTLTLNADGTFSYVHNGSETTTDSFTYKVNDGTVDGNTVTVNIVVTPVNNAPVSVADSITVAEGGTATLLVGGATSVLANDTDAENNTLTAVLVTGPTNGTLTLNANGTFSYVHNGSETTTDSFTYRANDGTANGNIVTVNINVTPVNDAPIAVADSITVAEGGTATVLVGGATSVLANDTDAENNPLAAVLVTGPTNGTLTLNANGTFSYVHNGSETTTDSFTYRANDGTANGNIVTVNINVTPVNDAPIAVADSITVAEGGTATALVGGATSVLANDSDAENNPLNAILVTGPTNGALTLNANGTFSYVHNGSETTTDSFTYKVNDGSVDGNTVTVAINVTPVNDAPISVADSITVAEGGTATALVGGATSVLANDTDAENNPLTAILVTGPTNGALTLNANGTFSYVHNGSETTTDSFTYRANDGTANGNIVTVNINVTPVNDAPIAVADSITVAEGGTATVLVSGATSVLANDSDAENNPLNAILVTGPTNGTLTLNANGTFSYVHNGSETTTDSFTYKVNDGTVDGNTVTVNITVTPVNDAPQTNAVTVSGNEDSTIAITLSGSDVDGTVTAFVIKSLPANGTLYSDATLTTQIAIGDAVSVNTVYFKPHADWNGSTSFNYAARDNLGLEDGTPATVNITVNPVADAAILGTGAGSVKEDTPAQSSASGTLSIVDPDAGEAEFIAQTGTAGTYGSFSINAAGAWVYNLDNSKPGVQALKEGETRTEVFNVVSKDGTPTTVTVTVNGTNDGPVAVADSATVYQGSTLTLTPAQLLGNDFDIDGDSLSITNAFPGVTNGSVSLVGGNVVFTPAAGYSGPASFIYTISDGKGGTSTATVSITVLPNAAPDAVDDPSGASAYSVKFGDASASDLWNNLDSKGLAVNITGFTAANVATALYQGTVDGNANTIGVQGSPRSFSDVPNQIEYDVATGKSESIVMTFNGNLNQASFGVNRLFPGESGGEIGLWEAYYNGVLVASSTFRLLGNSEAGTFNINTGNVVFNSIKFSALHTNNSTGDGGDYYLTSFAGTGPASANSSLKVIAGSSNTINAATLLTNDTDADNDTLSIISVQGATNGTVSLVGGNVVFTPNTGYTGPASFTYTISDGHGGTDTAKADILVERLNTAPHTVSDSVAVATNSALTIASSTLLANDSDAEGDAFMLMSVQSAVNGTVSIVGSNIVFTPTSNYEGPASFTYTVRDVVGATSTATVNVGVGTASAPSVVVSKALVVNAHGTGGTSVKFPITTKLVDTDGSETLSIKVSNVPTNLSFNSGVNLGGGVWQFTEADLPNLTLNVPGSYTTNATHLTVQVTSTEVNGGFTASTSTVVTLKAGYTTVDVTTTDSGNYTGSSASEFISGGNGNNTINGNSGNNIINGGGGNDNLSAGASSDVINGGSGNDTIHSGSGADRISGGSGNDTLTGGDAGETFVDVFVWSLGDQGTAGAPAVDTINNFATNAAGSNTTGGDVLDLRDLLQGESVGASNGAGNLANYLHFEVSGGSTIVHISHTGGFTADSHSVGGSYTSGAETQQIVLNGVNLQSLYSGATTDQQIITQLLNNQKLITD